jgi:hypothetical protein
MFACRETQSLKSKTSSEGKGRNKQKRNVETREIAAAITLNCASDQGFQERAPQVRPYDQKSTSAA